jgi:hypothetical protein
MAFDTCTVILGPLAVGLALALIAVSIRAHNAKNDIKRLGADVDKLTKDISDQRGHYTHILNQVRNYHDEKSGQKAIEVLEGWNWAHKALDELEGSLETQNKLIDMVRSLTSRHR